MAKRKPKRGKGFRETQQPFQPAIGLDGIYAAYGFACAFTGVDLSAEAKADPRGYLLAIGDDPMTTDATHLLPACIDAIRAYERGHLALGPRYNFLVDLEQIDPELLEQLNPIGRLRLPRARSLRPSLAALAAHRDAFAAGRFATD